MTGNRRVRVYDLLIWVLLALACWSIIGLVVWAMFR
jgi:hypothetical protein